MHEYGKEEWNSTHEDSRCVNKVVEDKKVFLCVAFSNKPGLQSKVQDIQAYSGKPCLYLDR